MELAQRIGLPADLVLRLHRAAGFSALDPDEQRYDEGHVELFETFGVAAELFGEAAVIDFTRVLGSSFARMAEAAVAMFLSSVQGPLAEVEAGELALAQANTAAVEMLDTLPAAMNVLFLNHLEAAQERYRAASDDMLGVEVMRLAVGFVDLAGFTALSSKMPTSEVARLVTEFEARAGDAVATYSGRVVKLIGDEVMFVAPDTWSACEAALTMSESFLKSYSDLRPRGGIAFGAC